MKLAKQRVSTVIPLVVRGPEGDQEAEVIVEGVYIPGTTATRYDPPEYPEVEDVRAYRYDDRGGEVRVLLDDDELEDAVVALIAEAERGW